MNYKCQYFYNVLVNYLPSLSVNLRYDICPAKINLENVGLICRNYGYT